MLDTATRTAVGGRSHMEDFVRLVQPYGDADLYAAVFDGHGGPSVAQLASERLHEILGSVWGPESREDAVRSAFADFEAQVAQEKAGAVAVVCVIEGGTLTVANIGDSHALLVSEANQEIVTTDHRVENERERERVVAAGAWIRGPYMCLRDGNGVMNARAFGDAHFREIGLIAKPNVEIRALRSEDRWLILGSDGVWDSLQTNEIADSMRGETTAAAAADRILERALAGGTDNTSVVVIRLESSSESD